MITTTTRWCALFLTLGALSACTVITEDSQTGGSDGVTDTSDPGSGETDSPPPLPHPPPGRYHPLDWSDANQHGPAANLQEQECTSCHGDDLTGGGTAPVGCDACHQEGWRTNCTYCHGGDENSSGGPPRYIDGLGAGSSVAFTAHTAHNADTRHPSYACSQCHNTPSDVLSAGHIFVGDNTAGQSEVIFGAGLSDQANYTGQGCTNNYCHGNGRGDNGAVSVEDSSLTCTACHPGRSSSSSAWSGMSGKHRKHMREGLDCGDCHGASAANNQVVNPSLHVNGSVETSYPQGFSQGNTNCTGFCHGEGHFFEGW